MKKWILVTLLLAGMSVIASAQENRWFVGGSTGLDLGISGKGYESRAASGFGAGFFVDAFAGKFFNPNMGFRFGYQGINTSNTFTDFGKTPFHYFHGDFLYRPGSSIFRLYAHAGVAIMRAVSPVAGLGAFINVPLADRVALIGDMRGSMFLGSGFADRHAALGGMLSASLGVSVSL